MLHYLMLHYLNLHYVNVALFDAAILMLNFTLSRSLFLDIPEAACGGICTSEISSSLRDKFYNPIGQF